MSPLLAIETRALGCDQIADVRVTPFEYDRQAATIKGCVYSNTGQIVPLSQRTSGVGGDRVRNADPTAFPLISSQKEFGPGKCVYLGHLMGHYGHFLLETLSSFWILESCGFDFFVFHPFIFGGKVQPFMEPFFKAFGISLDRIVVIRECTIFDKLVVPERSFRLNEAVNVLYAELPRKVMRSFSCPATNRPSRKLFLSRSKLNTNNRTVANQVDVDGLMASLGFEVIYPEIIPIEKQITLYVDCVVLAGFSGSALHNGVFCPPNTRVIEIGDLRTGSQALLTQQLCNRVSGLDGRFIKFKAHVSYPDVIDLHFLREKILYHLRH